MTDVAILDNLIPEEASPCWLDPARVYDAVHIRAGRIALLCFIPNTGTHDRYLPLSDLRLIDPAKDGTELILEFSSLTVVVTGRFLRRIPHEIAIGRCAALEAFDQLRRDLPEDPAAPFIESIRFLSAMDEPFDRPDLAEGAADAARAGNGTVIPMQG